MSLLFRPKVSICTTNDNLECNARTLPHARCQIPSQMPVTHFLRPSQLNHRSRLRSRSIIVIMRHPLLATIITVVRRQRHIIPSIRSVVVIVQCTKARVLVAFRAGFGGVSLSASEPGAAADADVDAGDEEDDDYIWDCYESCAWLKSSISWCRWRKGGG